MVKISIIVPVYNSEEYLEKCVNSLLAQTEKDNEIILVDDGSPDNSGAICDEFASKNNNIKVIHKKNAGVSAARNTGIENAEGKYIGFVDADDWVEPDMFGRLLREAENKNADMVMCDVTTVYSDGRTEEDTITKLSGSADIKPEDIIPGLLMEMAGSACRCIYRLDFIMRYDIRFPAGIKFSEDRIFNIYAMGFSDNIIYLKESFYNRFVNVNSAVNSFHEDYFEAYKKSAEGTEKAIKEAWKNNRELQTAYLSQFIGGAIGAICNYYYKTSTLTEKQRVQKVKKLCEDEKLRNALKEYGTENRLYKWLYNRNITALIAYAKLANLKHKR